MKVTQVWILMISMLIIESAYPCTIEINSIEHQANRATHIVTGEVLEVDENTYTHPESPDYSIRVVHAATFRIEHVLKGHIEEAIIQLAFATVDSVELFQTAQCFDYPYETGDKKLLMLGPIRDDNSYWAPRLRPNIISLAPEDPQGSALYEYVSYVSEYGTRPIELFFNGENEYVLGEPIELEVAITNRMPIGISVMATPGMHELSEESKALLDLKLDQRGDHQFRETTNSSEEAESINVPGGQSRTLAIKLDAYYTLPVGSYGLEGNFYLGLTPEIRGNDIENGAIFRDYWANFGNEFSFDVVREPTLVKSMSWGHLKVHTCECP